MATLTLKKAIAQIQRLQRGAIAREAVKIMKTKVPVVTGDLRDSVNYRTVGTNTWSVGSNDIAASVVQYGRKEVRPVKAQALRWVNPKNGDVIYSQYSSAVTEKSRTDFLGETAKAVMGLDFMSL